MTYFQNTDDLPCSCFTQQQYLVTGFGVPGQLLTILSVKDVLWSAYPLSAKYKTEDCAFLGVDYLQLVFLEDDHVNYLGVVSLCIVVLVCWSPYKGNRWVPSHEQGICYYMFKKWGMSLL